MQTAGLAHGVILLDANSVFGMFFDQAWAHIHNRRQTRDRLFVAVLPVEKDLCKLRRRAYRACPARGQSSLVLLSRQKELRTGMFGGSSETETLSCRQIFLLKVSESLSVLRPQR